MRGEPDPLYDKAREVLLDVLEALGPQRPSLVLVGAQAIYLHTGEADIAVAPFTTDADVVIDPAELLEQPHLGDALEAAGFVAAEQPGQWVKDDVRVDLMVPDAVAPSVCSACSATAARKTLPAKPSDTFEICSAGRRLSVLVSRRARLRDLKIPTPSEHPAPLAQEIVSAPPDS